MENPETKLYFSTTSDDKIGLMVNNKLVGFLRYASLDERKQVNLAEPVIGTKGTAYIESVEIFPGHKGHNHSDTLLKLAEKWFKLQGYTELAVTSAEPYLPKLNALGYTEKFRFSGPNGLIFLRKKLGLSGLAISS